MREMVYRNYMADGIYYYARGEMHTKRYHDYITTNNSADDVSGEEIAADVIKRAGLVVV